MEHASKDAAPSGPEEASTPAPHEVTVRVRYVECDPMKVAHHSAYVVWLEMARTEMLRRGGVSYRDMEAQEVYFVVARLSIRYRRPIRYDDQIVVRTFITAAGRAKLDHGYELYRDGMLMATAETTLVCVDASGAPRSIPDHLMPSGS